MSYDKEIVKEQIELEDIYNLLDFFDAEPQMFNTYIIAKTICHGGDSHKLYYYENTQLFKCYSDSCGSFDVFELVQKVEDIKDLNAAVFYVVNFFNLQSKIDEVDEDFDLDTSKYIAQLSKLAQLDGYKKDKVVLPELPIGMLDHYPQPEILDWTREGISPEVCCYMGIKYDPVNGNILIPHYDEDSRLVGIRQRTLVQEQEVYGKYRPARIQGQLCNHPLAFNLYGFNQAKPQIKQAQLAIIVEGEKSVLQYMSYFGTLSNICVAVCGSSISQYQFQLLLDAGVKEIVLGFDKDFQEMRGKEYDDVVKKIDNIYNKYKNRITISVLFDKWNLLGYKNSPLDCGKEAFLYLWRNRIMC
jgi:hypothetical protein